MARSAAESPGDARSTPVDPASETTLQVSHISRSFAGVRALEDVSFRVERGAVCGIIGPNGAGKSTLLNIINGVYKAESGSVTLFDSVLTQGPRQAAELGVGRTFQNIALFKGLSVFSNLVAGQRLQRRSNALEQALRLPRAAADAAQERDRAEEILALLHLTPYRETLVGTLPYGLQKRVELGRALASRPRILLLDEPMAGMSSSEKDEMCAFIRSVRAVRDVTVVLIEHDMGVVMRMSDQLVVLDYGLLLADGAPATVGSDPRVIAAYLGAEH